jgi:hypothetical protein
MLVLHLFNADGTASIPSMHYHGAGDQLTPVEGIQDNALIVSGFVVFVPSELAICRRNIKFLALDSVLCELQPWNRTVFSSIISSHEVD